MKGETKELGGKRESTNVAKCNLGKVKIEPMIVVGCVFWGQQITPKAHVTQCGVVARAWCHPFASGSTLLVCLSIVAFS